MRVVRGSETMLLVELERRVDPAINQQAIDLAARLRERGIPGVRDLVPAYCSVGVHFDPLHTNLVTLEQAIADLAPDEGAPDERADADPATPGAQNARPGTIEIPVRYGGDDGPDLAAVAAWAGCSPDDVVTRHAAREYRVYMLGFVGGFAYLGTVDPSIAAPRRRTPRERVPVGSVGIAGPQTGVYPLTTPGGWQIVGRTDLRTFDIARTPPNLLSPGDRVRFVPVRSA